MKRKNLKSLIFLGIGVLAGCSTINEEPMTDSDSLTMYESVNDGLDRGRTPTLADIKNNCAFDYLMSLTDEQLDSIMMANSQNCTREELESAYDASIDALIEETSSEDVVLYFDFINKYAEMGGHSFEFVEGETEYFPEKIKLLSIKTASTFDELIGVGGEGPSDQQSICRLGLDIQFMKMASMIVFAEFAPLDVTAFIAEGAYTIAAYKACTLTGHWY